MEIDSIRVGNPQWAIKMVVRWLGLFCILLFLLIGALRADDCELARTTYLRALDMAEDTPAKALEVLGEAIALCPSAPHGWLLRGNIESSLGKHAAALRAYRRAAQVAEQPRSVATANAHIALSMLRLGDVCAAQRKLRELMPGQGKPVAEWLRGPWEAFARAMADADLSTEQIACSLVETPEDRSLGVCPRVDLRIEFAFDSHRIERNSRALVDKLAEALRRLGAQASEFRLIGHTDPRGDAAYNQALSERRAESLHTALLALDRALEGRIETSGRGEHEPLVRGESEADHRVNRRVEVQVSCGM